VTKCNIITLKYTEKKLDDHNSEVFIVSIWGLLHVSVQWTHLQVIHISKIKR